VPALTRPRCALFATADGRVRKQAASRHGARRETQTGGNQQMEDTIRRVQAEFDRAELHADRESLRRLLTDDFLSIGPKGFILTKDQWIDRHDQFSYQALDTSEMDVRLHNGAAIVRNVQRNRATYDGHPVELAVRVGQVWVNEQGQWRLTAIQFSPMAE